MTSANRVKVQQCALPLTPPAFYSAKEPPVHHTSKGFASPWPSVQNHGMMSFFKARLFDWDEVPLPSTDALPPSRTSTWIPTNTSKRGDIRYTWLGHAACHFNLPTSGSSKPVTILTDPVFSQRCSPSQTLGPKRYTNPPTSVQQMAESKEEGVWPDLLVISHNHYDHLDFDTIRGFLSHPNGRPKPHIFCPLGLAVWFKGNHGVKEDEITELDWWQDRIATIEGDKKVKLTCVPAQHFSSRSPFDRDQTLWAGWTFEGVGQEEASSSSSQGKKVYFVGDSGLRSVPRGASQAEEDELPICPAFKEIGDTLGPFDLSFIPIGAYEPRHIMSKIHVS